MRKLLLAVCTRGRGVALFLLVFAASSGCQMIDHWRGPGYGDKEAETLRKGKDKPEKKRERFFFDERANEIERHLGL